MESAKNAATDKAALATLTRELEKGLASGISKRTPAQIRADYRRARRAA